MDYEIVQVEDQGEQWWQIKTLRGEKGFVSAKLVASPIGYRAIFNKNRRGEWKLSGATRWRLERPRFPTATGTPHSLSAQCSS